ncbi:MAG TPA: hypothetical protein PK289_09170 [Bacteroidia bacterium]|nr:hypothetical protein [Bacteroidia bacterium]HRG51867.1 hypothetical protein [Bacteroidia bacterium]
MKLFLSSLVFIFLNASNCASDQHFKEIKFGSGGGFTGAVTEYRLKENGDIYKSNSGEGEPQLIKSITAEELKLVREKLGHLNKDAFSKINHPYNVYYFIQIDTLKVIWGDPSYSPPKELEDLYNYLNLTATKK